MPATAVDPGGTVTLAVALAIREGGWLPFVLGFAWFLAVIARGIQYESDLPRDRAWLVAIGAFGGLLLADAVFGISPILRP